MAAAVHYNLRGRVHGRGFYEDTSHYDRMPSLPSVEEVTPTPTKTPTQRKRRNRPTTT